VNILKANVLWLTVQKNVNSGKQKELHPKLRWDFSILLNQLGVGKHIACDQKTLKDLNVKPVDTMRPYALLIGATLTTEILERDSAKSHIVISIFIRLNVSHLLAKLMKSSALMNGVI